MPFQIGSVSPSDVEQPEGKGPDERDLEASLKNPNEDPDPPATDEAPSDDVDSRGPSSEGELRGEQPADEPASNDDLDTTPGEGSEEPGEESEDDTPAPTAAAPPPPPGFASWEEATKAANEAKELRRWAEYGRQAYESAHKATQAPPRQQAAEEPVRPSWSPRHSEDPAATRAYLAVMAAQDPAKAVALLPPHLQQKVNELHEDVESKWAHYRTDPRALFNEQFAPLLARTPWASDVATLVEKVNALEARLYVESQGVLKDPEARKELAGLLDEGMSRDRAMELLSARRALKAGAATKQKVDDRARSQQATKARNRESQAAKRGSGRTGVPAADVKPSSDFDAMLAEAKRLHGFKAI